MTTLSLSYGLDVRNRSESKNHRSTPVGSRDESTESQQREGEVVCGKVWNSETRKCRSGKSSVERGCSSLSVECQKVEGRDVDLDRGEF